MTYTIRGIRETGTITYHCSTTTSAIDKVRDFHRAEYGDVTISADSERNGANRTYVTLLDLEAIASPLN